MTGVQTCALPIYVGDSTWDMLAAVAADMTAIGVTTGSASADELWRAGASQVLASLGELAVPDR